MEILSLGEKIKKRRKELNMTLKDLAGDRITPGQISLVESGRSNPSMDLLEYLAFSLSTSVEYLMETEKTQAEKISLYFEQVAEGAILSGDTKKAEEYIESALNYAKKYKLEYRKAKCLYLKGLIYLNDKVFIKAQQYFMSANSLFIKTGSHIDIVNTYLNISKISIEAKAYYSANSYLKEAEKIYLENKLSQDIILGEIYYLLAKNHYFLEDMEKSKRFTSLSKNEFEKLYDRLSYAKSLGDLADEYSNVGDMKNAILYSKKSIDIYKEITQLEKMGNIENSLGKLFYEFDNNEESLEHYERARKIREDSKDIEILDTLINICENYIKVKNITKCIEILKIIKSNLSVNDIEKIIEYNILYFRIHVLQDNVEEAEIILLDALNLANENKLYKKEADIAIKLGKFYLEYKRDYEAAKYLDYGINTLKKAEIIKK